VVKNLAANAGDTSSIPGSGRSLGVGNGKPLQYSCLGNTMDTGAWWATVHGSTRSQIQLSMHTRTSVCISIKVSDFYDFFPSTNFGVLLFFF